MQFKLIENISNDGFCWDINFISEKFKKLDEFLEELKKSVDTDGIVYINKTTWANRLRIDRKTLSSYINQFIDSSHFINVPCDDERYDKAKSKTLCCLKIVQEPYLYKEELIAHLRDSLKNFKPKSWKA
ncbi:MAG: hypothetical protein FJX70_07885 [Alphaproteobacteria bacterium]|nr:hypothetical protein [Alphaproteobacteria bacterium]